MNKESKKALYESIMKSVSKEVKRALNEQQVSSYKGKKFYVIRDEYSNTYFIQTKQQINDRVLNTDDDFDFSNILYSSSSLEDALTYITELGEKIGNDEEQIEFLQNNPDLSIHEGEYLEELLDEDPDVSFFAYVYFDNYSNRAQISINEYDSLEEFLEGSEIDFDDLLCASNSVIAALNYLKNEDPKNYALSDLKDNHRFIWL